MNYRYAIRLSAIMSLIIGLSVMMGWFLDIVRLKSVLPGLNTMKFNAALCISLLGLSLLFMQAAGGFQHAIYRFSAIMSGLISLLTLSEIILGQSVYIDELFVTDISSQINGSIPPGRMAPATAVSILLLSLAFLNIKSNNRAVRTSAQFTLHFVTLLTFIAIVGYLYNVPEFYKFSFLVSMALHTAVSLCLLSVAASFVNSDIGITGLFTGQRIGNIIARRFFPVIGVIIIALGYLSMLSYRHNLVSTDFGIALFSISFFLVCFLIFSITARYLNRIDLKRSEADAALITMNNSLEEKIKERTKSLQISETQLQTIFGAAPDSVIVIDGQGKVIKWNPKSETLFGWQAEEVLGRPLSELIIPERYREAHQRGLKHYLQTGEDNVLGKTIEIQAIDKNNREFDVALSISPAKLEDRDLFIGFVRDITEQKKNEEELHKAKKVAEEASHAKERFMANMSHEIRTPMNAIIGFTNLMEKSNLEENDRQYLSYIKSSGESLLVLINDILDYSKIEAGMMTLEKIPFRPADLLHSIETMFAAKAAEKKLRFEVSIDQNVPQLVEGDPTRLTQILINLVGNALKFTESGGVQVDLSLVSIIDKTAYIQISVRDTGIGIPLDKIDDIFGRFVQASVETTRSFGGSGLGLSIVKSLVELQGGTIEVKSSEGKGTEFIVNLAYPIKEEEWHDRPRRSLSEAKPLRFDREVKVLLCEDNRMNQRLAKEVLSRYGCQADIAENGGIAVEMAKREKYDIILMDIQMPIMDGYMASAKIRSELRLNVPIIAMTAHVMPNERDKCLSFGMNDYISKPFQYEELFDMISKYVGGPEKEKGIEPSFGA